MTKYIPRSNIRNYRPKQEAADLLFVLEQIAAWRAKHGEQTAPTDSEGGAPVADTGKPTPAA